MGVEKTSRLISLSVLEVPPKTSMMGPTATADMLQVACGRSPVVSTSCQLSRRMW